MNQCPIAPGWPPDDIQPLTIIDPVNLGHSFSYNFDQDQAGTFWYHSHHSTQYCDGLRGPLIVYDKRDPQRHLYDVDDGELGCSMTKRHN